MNIEPSSELSDKAAEGSVYTPDFCGMAVDDAISLAKNLGTAYEVVGTGEMVTGQFPKEGDILSESSVIILYS